jgi:pyrroloquinoline quinone biosynthesis protein B
MVMATKIYTVFFLLSSFAYATTELEDTVSLVVLGVAQDAGYPQINCYKPHCMPGWENPENRRKATSLALIDQSTKQKFLFEATPDIKQQLYQLHLFASDTEYSLDGIFLTHGHMGHYTGLMHFGKEAAGTKEIPVFAMPRMEKFLSTNGPWNQLVKLKNILLKPINNNQKIKLNKNILVIPLLVPHRDEYTETVGYKITGPNKTALFIPDIDKWQKWQVDITQLIKEVDYAFLDATFFSNGELPNRDMSEVPHPFVEESMQLFSKLSEQDKSKVIFIHFNHSNPLLIEGSKAQQQVEKAGFRFATEGMSLEL